MKTFIFSIVSLLLVILSVITNSVLASDICEKYLDMINEAYSADSENESKTDLSKELAYFQNLKKEWEKDETKISLSVNHGKLTEINQNLAAVIGACEANDYSLYLVYIMKTTETLAAIKDLCGVSFADIV